VILTVVCILAILAIAYLANRKVEKAILEMRAETSAREAALNKQAKVFVRKLAVTERAAAKTVDASRATVEEARALNANTQNFFSDRRVQRLLDRGGE
jgi:hypothetical protein